MSYFAKGVKYHKAGKWEPYPEGKVPVTRQQVMHAFRNDRAKCQFECCDQLEVNGIKAYAFFFAHETRSQMGRVLDADKGWQPNYTADPFVSVG